MWCPRRRRGCTFRPGGCGEWGIPGTGLKKEVKPYWSEFLLDCIRSGVREREALKAACRKQGMAEDTVGQVFQGWGGLLKEMCDRGMIAYETGTSKRFAPLEPVPFMDRDEARAALIRCYFAAFGPAAMRDCAAFTGYGMREVRRLMEVAALPLREAACDGETYFHLNDLAGDGRAPRCLFLAGFDQLVMGYRDRGRFMGAEDLRHVITATGFVFPTILVDGRLRARWKMEGAKIAVTPFYRLTAGQREAVHARAEKVFGGGKVELLFSE